MKKLHVLAIVATLLTVGSAFAQTHGRLFTQANATFAAANTGPFGGPGGPTSTNNDDTCDIGTAPAATLLLPYFEVDINNNNQATAVTTLFTIVNVSNVPQIAHLTIWTDWSFPVLDFNIFLTGYDVQSINLYDILNRGIIAPNTGTSNTTTRGTSNGGFPGGTTLSLANSGAAATAALPGGTNPNFAPGATSDCAGLVGNISNLPIFKDVQTALTTGVYAGLCGPTLVGGTHANAKGYITIDVDSDCTTSLPNTRDYFAQEILYDNVLIGDYQSVNPAVAIGTNGASGSPLVHIRAIPEGGPAGRFQASAANPTPVTSNLPFTFYDRYTQTANLAITAPRNVDSRQPLPSTFAARYIEGGVSAFGTNLKIWREGITGSIQSVTCSGVAVNASLAVSEIVRFDEHENFVANVAANGPIISPVPKGNAGVVLPETSSTPTSNTSVFPALNFVSGDQAGWFYLNLNNGGVAIPAAGGPSSGVFSAQGPAGLLAPNNPGFAVNGTLVRPSQNWVIVSMSAQGRFSVDFNAAWLGNGCSAPAAISQATNGAGTIGPAGGFVSAVKGVPTGAGGPFANVTP
jgi:hypothetical protein